MTLLAHITLILPYTISSRRRISPHHPPPLLLNWLINRYVFKNSKPISPFLGRTTHIFEGDVRKLLEFSLSCAIQLNDVIYELI